MNDIEKRIEEILLEEMCDCNPYGKYQTREEVVSALTNLYHQLLSEERKRLIGVVEGLMTPPMDWEYDDRDGSQYCKGCNYSPKEGCRCATKNAALQALLATLNKEKD